jgi:hypothetical protein
MSTTTHLSWDHANAARTPRDNERMAFPRDADLPWAHASGWMQLSGRCLSVSCVLTGDASEATALRGLPLLSDTLTECGYPWEMLLAIDGRSTALDEAWALWRDVPGFRRLELPAGGEALRGLAYGLSAARGDAIVVIRAANLAHPDLSTMIRAMILRWETDAAIVFPVRAASGGYDVTSWDRRSAYARLEAPGASLPPHLTELALLDRSIVDSLD